MFNDRQMKRFVEAGNLLTRSLIELEQLGYDDSECQKFYESASKLKERIFDRWAKEVKLRDKAKGGK